MNGRERLLNALSLKKTDRVPISTYEMTLPNNWCDAYSHSSYLRLTDYIREKTDCVCMWNPVSDESIIGTCTAFKPDTNSESVRDGKKTTTTARMRVGGGEITRVTSVIDNVSTVWQTKHWCETPDDVDKIMSLPYITPKYDFSEYQKTRTDAGDNGIVMATLADPLCVAAQLMEFGDFTVWAMTEREHFLNTLIKLHERIMTNIENMLKAQTVDLYRICGPEYATAPYLPPELFRQYVVPFDREICTLIRKYGSKSRVHSHGKMGALLDDFLAIGTDAIDPCEDTPDGDTLLADVKKNFQNKICIFGNVQLKDLENADAKRIREIVKQCMDAAKEGGGYVIMPTASPINIPLSPKTEENYFEFINAALDYGKY